MVPVAFRLKVSPVTSGISLQCRPVAGIARYVTWRTWVSSQSKPTYHIVLSPLQEPFLGGSGPSIPSARSSDPLIIDGPRKSAREGRSLLIGQAVWRQKPFPGSIYRAGLPLLSPYLRGLVKILTYKETA